MRILRTPQKSFQKTAAAISAGLLLVIAAQTGLSQYGTGSGDWPSYGGDAGSTKYSPLNQITPENFWLGFDKAIHELAPKNKELIDFREILQKKIDKWHIENKENKINLEQYKISS